MEEDWKATQSILKNISQYPFILVDLPPATRKVLKPIGGAETETPPGDAEAAAKPAAPEPAAVEPAA